MYRQSNTPVAMHKCPECSSESFLRVGGRTTCRDCGALVDSSYKDAKEKTRICKQCGETFVKDPRYSMNQWVSVRFCGNKCSSESRRKHANSIAKQEAFRRKRGVLRLGSPVWVVAGEKTIFD